MTLTKDDLDWAGLRIKRLEWESRGAIGSIVRPARYILERSSNFWHLYRGEYESLGVFDTADEAKAAAQADYETFILSTLEHQL